jgi:hypothetical protein
LSEHKFNELRVLGVNRAHFEESNRPCQVLKILRGKFASLVIALNTEPVLLGDFRYVSCLLTGLHNLNLLESVTHEADERLGLLVHCELDRGKGNRANDGEDF